jgi:hypothetical protein
MTTLHAPHAWRTACPIHALCAAMARRIPVPLRQEPWSVVIKLISMAFGTAIVIGAIPTPLLIQRYAPGPAHWHLWGLSLALGGLAALVGLATGILRVHLAGLVWLAIAWGTAGIGGLVAPTLIAAHTVPPAAGRVTAAIYLLVGLGALLRLVDVWCQASAIANARAKLPNPVACCHDDEPGHGHPSGILGFKSNSSSSPASPPVGPVEGGGGARPGEGGGH